MEKSLGLSVKKPVSVWNKPLKLNYKDFFKSLGKAVVSMSFQQWGEAIKDVVEMATALGFQDEDSGQVAWRLINTSMMKAIYELVGENEDIFRCKAPDVAILAEHLDLSLETLEIEITSEFFIRPKEIPIVTAMIFPFCQWLKGFGLSDADAQAIAARLPAYFVFALNENWGKYPQKYACLKDALDTPFTKAGEIEQGWSSYSAFLQKQVETPMFAEAFGLSQVYVPLCGYYEEKDEDERDFEHSREKKYKRIVVDLEKKLEEWLNKSEYRDAIRLISGGPGCGKSSFAKMLAARQAEKGKIRTLFIPLHHFDVTGNIEDAVGNYVKRSHLLPYNPLDNDKGEKKLFIIFDGLDELSMQGKVASEVAQQFLREVQRKVSYNSKEVCLKALITGREMVVQANSGDFRKPEEIIHVLPYYVEEDERQFYIDSQKLMKEDKRQTWWEYYGKASGKGYTCMPQEVDKGRLVEITSQPLLNYLVALSYDRKVVDFSKENNLNVVYADLIKAVYERGWADCKHPTLSGISEDNFTRVLEEIAVAAWHGSGRTTTVREIETHCEGSGIKRLLGVFEEGATKGVTRLLTAFYFRQAGHQVDGEKTFEFTHKSFDEYLTAKRIVRELKRIHKQLEQRKQNIDEGWDEQDALLRWIMLCGKTTMDEYIFDFVCDEMELQDKEEVSSWQETICGLIGFMLRYGMPFQKLGVRSTFIEEMRQSRNAEEALLAVLSACARVTSKVSKVDWSSKTAFGEWIARLQGQREGPKSVLALDCLNFLDLSECSLYIRDFFGANFFGSILEHSSLLFANLACANIRKVNIREAKLAYANLSEAKLNGTDLRGANLRGASLGGANLREADLRGVDLREADLRGADFEGADLGGADLGEADLKGANLDRVNVKGTILEKKKPKKRK